MARPLLSTITTFGIISSVVSSQSSLGQLIQTSITTTKSDLLQAQAQSTFSPMRTHQSLSTQPKYSKAPGHQFDVLAQELIDATALNTNPLLVKSTLLYETPEFDKIKLEHFKPAILHGMKLQKEEIRKITNQKPIPTFENTILAYELSGSVLGRALGILRNLSRSDSTDEIMALEDELIPIYSSHADDISFDQVLFKRIDTVFQQLKTKPDKFSYLTPENHRLIEITHQNFLLAGSKLNESQRAQMRALNSKLSSLEQTFSNNITKILQVEGVQFTDLKDLEGLSQAEIDEAASIAKEQGVEGYVLNLVNTTRNPLLTSLKNRETRRKLFDLSVRRGLEGKYVQTELVYDILVTRAKTAKLLGFKNFSEFKLQKEMATPESAREMLVSVVKPVMKNLARETASLKALFEKEYPGQELQNYDWEFFAERVREADFNVDPTVISKYFEFNNVLENCVFHTFKLLFGITFKRRDDIPVQHDNKDIYTYECFDHDGTSLGLFHADYFKRPAGSPTTKVGGAWMSKWVGQNFDRQQKPVIINNMNIVKAKSGPTFLTLSSVSTMLHELGHGLHGMLSRAQHLSLSGTATSRDYVEFPSTVQEDWSIHPEILKNYAKHYETGEEIPQELLQSVIKASKFNLGFKTLEYVTAALIDLEWHSLPLEELEAFFAKYPTKSEAIDAFEVETLKRFDAYSPLVPPRYRQTFFSHSMTGGYSSRYYAYFWAEVLAADAFRYITELCDTPGPNRAIGDILRKNVYETGNTRDPIVSYESFRGKPATTDAILIRRGLTVEEATQTDPKRK